MPATPEQLAGGIRGGQKAGIVARERADKFYAPLDPIMAELRAQGLGYAAIATKLNELGHRTRLGNLWNRKLVSQACRGRGIE
jgi:hypothetical protein